MKKRKLSIPHFQAAAPLAVVCNILLVYVAYSITRLAFFLENIRQYTHLMQWDRAWQMFWAGLYFDSSAIAYTNILYLLLMLFPLMKKETAVYHRICKGVFLVVNGLGLSLNLMDCVYFQYTSRRTTMSVFNVFGADDKVGSIIGLEFLNHWYLVLLFVVLMALLWICYVTPKPIKSVAKYYIVHSVSLLLIGFLFWAGMRGGFWDNRPIRLSTATQFIVQPNDASLILNTPFSMIRTVGKNVYEMPDYYANEEELEKVFSPIHAPFVADSVTTKKNVVVIILESFSREYVGYFNKEMLPGYEGYAPFLDSLASQSLTFRYSYANGRASIDAMPAALSGLPMFKESFVAASCATNHLEGLAGCLTTMGYQTAFFHGAPASSLGFQGFTKSTGFQACWSEEDYDADPRTNGEADSDNWWGIWDEPFLQYFRMKMTDMQEPFMTTIFTLSSHHPFQIPEQYKDVFPEGELPIHKCIRYTDHALREFFRAASQEPWFNNTVFILIGDHVNKSNHEEYKRGMNMFSSSLIIYSPSGDITPGMRDGIAQHTDIYPTMLNYLGYDKPYMAFGCDLLSTPADQTWAVNYLDGIYQYAKNGYVLQFDGEKSIGVYELTDYLMAHNLVEQRPEQQQQMEQEVKAIIQQYMMRMLENRLVPEGKEADK